MAASRTHVAGTAFGYDPAPDPLSGRLQWLGTTARSTISLELSLTATS
jgi:hypothetical protein